MVEALSNNQATRVCKKDLSFRYTLKFTQAVSQSQHELNVKEFHKLFGAWIFFIYKFYLTQNMTVSIKSLTKC